MAVLHLENVPDELMRQIEQLAERERQTPAAKAVSLLQEAVGRNRAADTGDRAGGARTVKEILESIARNRFRPDPGGPTVVEMLREDRER
jgi:hypothetical protein